MAKLEQGSNKPEKPEEISDKEPTLSEINTILHNISRNIERTQIADYVQLLNRPRKLIVANLIAGVARGVGFAIGFSVLAGTLVYALQKLGALDLPIIGDYIAEIVKLVQSNLSGGY